MAQSKFDPFFSKSMESAPIAQALLWHHYLAHIKPQEVVDTLTRVDRTNTSTNLKKRHRDIAYEVTMQGGRRRLMCVEHQSQPDITIVLRFLEYSVGNLGPYLSEACKIPPLINMLLYNGDKSPYPYHNTLQAYYENPKEGAQALNLHFHLIDLTQISDKKLLAHGHCAPMEILLKHGRTANFELSIEAYREVFQACIVAIGDAYLLSMLDYAISLQNEEVGEKVYNFIKEIFDNKSKTIMTYGDRLRQEGMQQGMQQGIQQGMQQGMQQGISSVAQNMLHENTPIDQVIRWTGLSRQELASLSN